MADRPWVAMHIYYHEQQDRLLRDGVRPLLAELLGERLVEDHFYIRHWQGGPHVRLRLAASSPSSAGEAGDRAGRHLAAFLRSHGSAAAVDEAAFARLASALAQVERQASGASPLRPDNSIEFAPYHPDHGWTGAAGRAVEHHFTESCDIALRLLAATGCQNGAARAGHALTMMFTAAATWLPGGDPLLRYLDQASRTWAGIVFGAERAGWEAESARRYQTNKQRVCRLVSTLLAAVEAGALDDGELPLRRWADAVRRLTDALEASGARSSMVARTFSHCCHLHNNRLGVAVQQEAYLLFILCRAIREVVGIPGDRRCP